MTYQHRRRWLWLGAGLAAAATGAAVSWRRWSPSPMQDDATSSFWAAGFESPAGGPDWVMTNFRGKPLLVNFWATWCPPCVEEMPLLNRFYQSRRDAGWQVLGLAVDQIDPVRSFLTRLPMDFPIGMAGLSGVALSRSLGNETGGLPFTVVFSPQGQVVHRQVGKLSEADLDRLGQLFL